MDFDNMKSEMDKDFAKSDKQFKTMFGVVKWVIIVISVLWIVIMVVVVCNSDKIYQSAKNQIINEIKDVKKELAK